MRQATISAEVADEREAWSLAVGFSHVTSLVIWKRVTCLRKKNTWNWARETWMVHNGSDKIEEFSIELPLWEKNRNRCVSRIQLVMRFLVFSSYFSVYLWPWYKSVLNLVLYLCGSISWSSLYDQSLHLCFLILQHSVVVYFLWSIFPLWDV